MKSANEIHWSRGGSACARDRTNRTDRDENRGIREKRSRCRLALAFLRHCLSGRSSYSVTIERSRKRDGISRGVFRIRGFFSGSARSSYSDPPGYRGYPISPTTRELGFFSATETEKNAAYPFDFPRFRPFRPFRPADKSERTCAMINHVERVSTILSSVHLPASPLALE